MSAALPPPSVKAAIVAPPLATVFVLVQTAPRHEVLAVSDSRRRLEAERNVLLDLHPERQIEVVEAPIV